MAEPLDVKEFTLKDLLFLVADEYDSGLAEAFQEEFRVTYPFSPGLLGIELQKMKRMLIALHLCMVAATVESGTGDREYLDQGRTRK